jgi:hypothetical protein
MVYSSTKSKYIIALTAILMFIFLTTDILSQMSGFRGEMNIRVKNISGTAVNNTQVALRVNTAQLVTLGLMQSNGNDIRFASDCAGQIQLSFWVEGYLNTDSTKIWVKIPSIPANDSTILYMFFGNPAASSQSSLSTFNGPNSSTDSVASGGAGGVGLSQRGFRFTPTSSLLVTHFGKREPTGTTRYITLFDFNTQAVLRQKQVSGPAAQYSYDTLGSPIWLNSGTQYVIELFQGSGDGYYFGLSTQIGTMITYGDMRYCNSCTQNTFPTSILAGYHYGYPDFWYYYRDNVVTPEPTQVNFGPADTNTPAAPTGLQGTAGNTQVSLKWNKNTEFDIGQYQVYRNTTNTPGTATLIGTTNHPDTQFVATGLTNGTPYYFWVKAVDKLCSARISNFSTVIQITPTAIISSNTNIPKVFALYQNYPNPFNPITFVGFDIPRATFVRITVYDLLGREVDLLVSQYMAAGSYKADWDATNFASGLYIYKIEAGSFIERKKMMVVK